MELCVFLISDMHVTLVAQNSDSWDGGPLCYRAAILGLGNRGKPGPGRLNPDLSPSSMDKELVAKKVGPHLRETLAGWGQVTIALGAGAYTVAYALLPERPEV